MEITFTLETLYPTPCIHDMYLEVRDGNNKSASLLGKFCGRNFSTIVRSSGQNLFLNPSYYDSLRWITGYYKMSYFTNNKAANKTGKYCLDESI